jgi:hypothetical protein
MERWRKLAALAIAIAASTGLASQADRSQADGPSQIVEAHSAQRSPQAGSTVSMSSCMAASCHGGPVSQEPQHDAWKSSYTAWFTRDPHAKAYNDLFNARSRRMIARLEQGEPDSRQVSHRGDGARPYLAALDRHGCLACHASTTSHGGKALLATSLGCHDCHGADHGWVDQHYLAKWSERPENEQRALGMQPTKDLAGRAQVCVGCHIGAPAQGDSPRRDMNHDLIAAGHPRLNFEFAAYLANLPPHWDEEKDHERLAKIHDNVEADIWLTGQENSAIAALALVIDRAERAASDVSPRAVWPEFSEYDCYGCHHGLAVPTTRSLRNRNPGRWQWGTWHFALLEPVNQEFSQMKQLLERPLPDAQRVANLNADLRLPRGNGSKSGSVAEMIERLSAAKTASWQWDQYAQWYLGLRALQAACREEQQPRTDDAERALLELDRLLEGIEAKLRFSDHADSPWHFDPGDAQWKQSVDEARRLLPALVPAASN